MTPALAALALAPSAMTLVFDKPAAHFTESCPVGNGRLGAMDFGGTRTARIVLNENTMWSGWPEDQNRTDAHTHRQEILDLLFAGNNPEAQNLMNKYFTCSGPGSGHGSGKDGPFGCYQTLGDLVLETSALGGGDTGYLRTLDLSRAVSRTSWSSGGVVFTRETVSSRPDQVIAIRLTSSKPGALNFVAELDRKENRRLTDLPNGVDMEGELSPKLAYAAKLRVVSPGATVTSDGVGKVKVQRATEATLIIGAGTSYRGPVKGDHMGNEFRTVVAKQVARAQQKDWTELMAAHQKAHRRLFDRVSLDLPAAPGAEALPTVKRMEAVHKGGPDPAFAALYFNFGRYLLIGSSQKGGLPANLQGLWAEEYETPWNGDYHIDINVQMNYWPVDVCNLSECQEPLTSLVEALVEPGQRTAKAYYGAPGWVAHVITNPWAFTAPGEDASWGSTYSGSGWVCGNLFDRFAFTQDTAYLKRIYPILKGASDFFVASLVRDPKSGYMVTGPSNSPENAFRLPDGRIAHTCLGPAIDSQIVRELLANTIEAGAALGRPAAETAKLRETLPRLAPNKVGPDGRLQEWLEPYDEPEPRHRHTSLLYGLHPSADITRYGTPDLAEAARKTLERRGDESTGWSMAWKVCFWARLGDGDRAYKLLRDLWKPVSDTGYDYERGGGTYPNLLCAHPPFQIDGNFGATAGIAEMLLQSQRERPGEPYTISLLPALPRAWPTGSVRGLCARGGFSVDMAWSDGRLDWARIKRVAGTGPIRVRTQGPGEQPVSLNLRKGQQKTIKRPK